MTENKKNINYSKLLFLLSKKIFWNKYFIIFLFFCIWMFFFDTNSYLNHQDLQSQIENYKSERLDLENKLEDSKYKYYRLKTNTNEREKYARENYFMKRDNEDIIIVTYKEDSIIK